MIMTPRELQATIGVVEKLVEALSSAKGTTEEKAKQIAEACRRGQQWLKEWQATPVLTSVEQDTVLRKALSQLVAAASTSAQHSLRHKHGRCDEYDNMEDSDGMDLDRALERARRALSGTSTEPPGSNEGPPIPLPTFTLAPIPPGPDACPTCGIRQGLGTCSTCDLRMHRGIEGMEKWVALALWYIGEVPTTSERERQHIEASRALLWWAKGHDEDLGIPTRP